MKTINVKVQGLRKKMALKDIFTIAELAARVGCRRETIYFAIENPRRFPKAAQKIQEVLR